MRFMKNTPDLWSSMFVAGLVAVFASVIGCGGNADMGSVTGRMTLDGQPVPAGVTITFSPIERAPSRGITVEGGTYEMLFSFSKKGVMVGTSHVTFEVDDSEDSGRDRPKFKIPQKYRDNYGQTVDVKPGKQVINFDLTSD